MCLADAREPAMMASDMESRVSWEVPVAVRRMGRDRLAAWNDAGREGPTLGASEREAGSKTGGDSARVGVEDAETKLSLEDVDPAVEGLASAVSSVDVVFDESCPSVPVLATREPLRLFSLSSSRGRLPGSSMLFLGTTGRVLPDAEAFFAGSVGGRWSDGCLSSFSGRCIIA